MSHFQVKEFSAKSVRTSDMPSAVINWSTKFASVNTPSSTLSTSVKDTVSSDSLPSILPDFFEIQATVRII